MTAAATPRGDEDSREKILRAALATFTESGFDGATTRGIADRAGVSLGLLQYHFGAKDKLWRAAVDRAFAEMRTGLDAILSDPDLTDDRQRLRQLIHAYVRFVAINPEFVRLMHDEGKRRGPRMRWLVDRYVKPLYSRVHPLIERHQAAGGLPDDVAPFHFVYALVGAVGVIFHQAEECKRLTGVDPSDAASVEAHARAVEFLFLRSATPRRG